MEQYLEQLLRDIDYAAQHVSFPHAEKLHEIDEWISDEEEDRTAPVRELEAWTGIHKEQLPPAEMLKDSQVSRLLDALKKMLDAYNCSFVLQTQVPERIQYVTLRENFNQAVQVKQWHMGFFELCKPGTDFGKCTLHEYCQCSFYANLFSGMERRDEEAL